MIIMDYVLCFVVVLVVFGVVALSVAVVPYHGVVALMGVSFLSCVVMVIFGCTFTALMVYIVYLGGLIVVFSYCVSVEKDSTISVGGYKYFILVFGAMFLALLLIIYGCDGVSLLVPSEGGDYLCLEVCGYGVLYFSGGVGLLVCSWGLVMALFSVLVIINWSRLGGFRSF